MMGEGVALERGYSKCQDCGNQAKKECSHTRCRTCCKNKGFDCRTHVKSTWIPLDNRRRLRDQGQGGDMSKRLKNHNPDIDGGQVSGGVQELKFPGARTSMAMFRRVQVRSMDEAVNETAYQTSVKIGGHVFSGLLYDNGPFKGDSSSGQQQQQQQQQNRSVIMNASNYSAHQTHHDGASANMAPLSASAAVDDEEHFMAVPPPPYPFPFPNSFRPGLPYFSYPKP